jgi:hypothetical protein
VVGLIFSFFYPDQKLTPPPTPPHHQQVNDYHMLKAFNKSWATSALATKFNLTAAALASYKNKTVKGL